MLCIESTCSNEQEYTIQLQRFLQSKQLYKYTFFLARYFDQSIADLLLFVVFFILFPRDQSFYVLVVIMVTNQLNILLKVYFHEPHLYYTIEEINSPFCGHISGMSFGFPSQPLMLQICFDFSMFLTVFHASPGKKQEDN